MDARFKIRLLEIIDEVDRLCRENDLRYFLIGGSMLGAVRHKGMIPWDDDIDIGMPREDYELFKAIATEKMSSRYRFVDNGIDSEYHYFFGKVYHQETTLVEYEDPFYLGGVFVDIFPLDGMPESDKRRELHFRNFSMWLQLSRLVSTKNVHSKTAFKRFAEKLIKKIFSLSFCLNVCNRIARRYKFSSSEYVANLGGAWGRKEITHKKNFAFAEDTDFEGKTLSIPAGYDNILKEVYGDYMKLPPEEKRVSHHSHFYLNLDDRISADEILNRESSNETN